MCHHVLNVQWWEVPEAGSAVCGARGSCDAQGALASPLPGAQVHDQEPVVFVGVDVVEEVEG